MVDYQHLIRIFSTPRPSGSAAEAQAQEAAQAWLQNHQVPCRTETYRLYPYFFVAIGLWLILSRTALAGLVLLRAGWWTVPVALIGLAGGLLDVGYNIPLVGWPGARCWRNLFIELGSPEATQEVILSAHTDSKTEWLDHRQRMIFVKNLRLGIVLTLFLGVWGPVDHLLWISSSPWATLSYYVGIAVCLPLLILAWGLGANMALGWLRTPSLGVIDNGAACAVLLALADRLAQDASALQKTRLTLALFSGEEVNLQGSHAYVRTRTWTRPVIALNLEVLGQDGEYVLWEQDGTSLHQLPCSEKLNELVSTSIEVVTGQKPRRVGPVSSDGGQFLLAGIPATTLGTYDRVWQDRGFHSSADNLTRLAPERLPEAVEILAHFIQQCDQSEILLEIH